jgi:membrane dipeptidase
MTRYPMIDGHNDLPWQYRTFAKDNVSAINIAVVQKPLLQTDIPRLKQGRVGGQFWSVYVGCAYANKDAVRATQEQIDVVYQMVEQYPDFFRLALTADDVQRAFDDHMFPSLMGIEGGHQIDSSLGSLRSFYREGVRYMTLTHNCNTPWSQSCCASANSTVSFSGGLLSPGFGADVVMEMQRLGMFVDLSHVSFATMHTVLDLVTAPVIFSHSSAYALCPTARNVPDDVLRRLPKNGGVVMVNFYPQFISCSKNATIAQVVDHIVHIRDTASIANIGFGADFDGIETTTTGLEDVSRYPYLVAALYERGFSDADVIAIMGGNILRAMRQMETVALNMRGQPWGVQVLSNITTDKCRTVY